jgi:3-hydroxyacyl-CoA dehydrogenase
MGTHFFSPANVMKLLENVRGSHTSDLTIASMMAWGKQIGKWCILVGNCPGFVGNRMVNFYGGQARVMLEEGLMPEEVDGAATNFGMRVGPLAMSDIVGLDLGIQAWKKAGSYSPQTVIQHALIESGRLGQKTGKGFFDYDPKTRRASPSPEAAGLIQAVRAKNGAASLPHTLPFEGLGWGLPPPAMQHICSWNESEGVGVRPVGCQPPGDQAHPRRPSRRKSPRSACCSR